MQKLSDHQKVFCCLGSRTVRAIVSITILILFVLAAGAPGGLGGIGMQSVDSGDVGGQCSMSMKALNHMDTNALNYMSLKSPVQLCMP